MATIPNEASKGLVSSRDPSTLKQGELSEAISCEYHVGSPHLYKQKGRTATSAALGAAVRAIARMQYDTADSKLVAVAGGTVYESAESTAPTFAASTITTLSTTAVPQFGGFNERWLMQNGVDANRIREPNGVTTVGGVTGNWRPNGMQRPTATPTFSVVGSSNTTVRPTTATGTYTNADRAYDTDTETYASGGLSTTATWTFTTNFASAGCTLYVDHQATSGSGVTGPANPKFDVVDTGGTDRTLLVEYTIDNGTNWLPITASPGFSRTVDTKVLTTGTDIANKLKVRATCGTTHRVFDIRVTGGSASAYTTAGFHIFYGYTEIYTDSDGIEFESTLSEVADLKSTDINTKYGVTLTLGAAVNTRSTHYGIYRSVDENGGGYPFMYRIATQSISQGTAWTDDFNILPSTLPDDKPQLSFFLVTYPTGETFTYEAASPPPLAKMAIPFQGVVCYLPAATDQGHFLFYSLASTISARGMEQVPFFQYLDFQSPRNDTLVSGAVTNGGKSLLAFFANYTMLVNYLPQASDGVFDNRIKEYVSNNRGTAGRFTCCEFTLPAGQTLVASVDALGLWVTNGINQMDEWSRDLDWATDMAGVDLSVAELIDNPAKRRLELLYTLNGVRKERHFFYGRLKEDGDGKPGPLHTGPHPMGVRCKHYCQIGNAWVGFSGDSTTGGKVFLEESGFEDVADGYNSSGHIPFSFAFGDQYVGGLSRSQIAEKVTSRWGLSPSKTITLEVRGTRDKGGVATKTKQVTATPGTQSYIHMLADRIRCRYTDISSTQCPEFIGQEITVREGGPSRNA